MYAIIETGGKQYRVQEGDVITVEKLNAAVGETVCFDHVLVLGEGEGIQVGPPYVGTAVEGKVVDAAGLGEVAKIPTREVLLGRLFGSWQAPISSFARVVKQIAEKDSDAPAEAAAEAAPEAEPDTPEEKTDEVPIAELPQVKDRESIDQVVAAAGADALDTAREGLRVSELRKLARGYNGFSLTGRDISKANKKMLIEAFKDYYK